jgi:hypothetical protein
MASKTEKKERFPGKINHPNDATQVIRFFKAICDYFKFKLLKSSTKLNYFAFHLKLYLQAIHLLAPCIVNSP